jgi:multidrug resistance efflux pump
MAESRGFHTGRRFWALVGLAALLGYVAWIGAPYLRSVVVRDAAVTTWINATAAPIDGFLGDKPLHVGDSVGKDGLIATIENPLQDATPVVRAEADLNKAKQHVSGLQELMTRLEADAAARARTAMELAEAEVEAESAGKILASVKSAYEAAKFQPVKAPQDAYVWSLIASPGDFVRAVRRSRPGSIVASCLSTCRYRMSNSPCCGPTRPPTSSLRAIARFATARFI